MAKESARVAILSRTTWCRARSRFSSSKALLADVSAVRNCEVAEWTVVWMVGQTMSIDEDFVALMDRTLVSLDRSGVNSFYP